MSDRSSRGSEQNDSSRSHRPRGARRELPDVTEVLERREFLIPAGVGLVVVSVALLVNSPYSLVLSFSYFLVILPSLFLNARGRAAFADAASWRTEIASTGLGPPLRLKLKGFLVGDFPNSEEVARAICQFDDAVSLYLSFMLKVSDPDDSRILQARETLRGMAERFERCVKVFGQLNQFSTKDTLLWAKKVQALRVKSSLGEAESSELRALEDRIAWHQKRLSELIDDIRGNERALQDLATLLS